MYTLTTRTSDRVAEGCPRRRTPPRRRRLAAPRPACPRASSRHLSVDIARIKLTRSPTNSQTSRFGPKTLSWPPGVPIVPPKQAPHETTSPTLRLVFATPESKPFPASRPFRPPGASPAGARSSSPRGAPEGTWLHRRPRGASRLRSFAEPTSSVERAPGSGLRATPGARPRPGRGCPAGRRGGRAARPERLGSRRPAVGSPDVRTTYARRGRRGGGAPTRSGTRARPSTRCAPP